jgi:hypothetical protein
MKESDKYKDRENVQIQVQGEPLHIQFTSSGDLVLTGLKIIPAVVKDMQKPGLAAF